MNQQDKSFLTTFTTVIAVLVMLAVVIFLISRLVSIMSPEPADSSRRQATAEQRIKPIGQVRVASASAAAQQAAAPGAAAAATAPAASGQEVYTKVCAACHMAGVMNSPKTGSKEAWEPRFAQGLDTLVSHAVNGIRAMPAKGGNPALTDKEIEAAIVHMLKESGIEVAAAPAAAPASAAAPAAAPAPAPAAAAPAPAAKAAPAAQKETPQELLNAAQEAVKAAQQAAAAARQAAGAARQAAETARRALLTAEQTLSAKPEASEPPAEEPEAVPAPPPAPAVKKPVPAPQTQTPAPAPAPIPAPAKEPAPAPQSQAPAPAPKPAPAPVAEKPAPVPAPPAPQAAAPTEIVIPTSVSLIQGQQVYNAVCLACHSTGAAGAPKLGDKAAWAPRLAQGFDTLVQHSLKGYKAMPAKGGRLDLPDSSVLSAVGYMVSQAKP